MISKESLLGKALGIGVVLSAFSYFSPKTIFTLMIVLGQAHFLITYVYQWKGGKITYKYLFLYVAVCVILLTAVVPVLSLAHLALLTGIIFSAHFFFDEYRHIEGTHAHINLYPIVPPAVLFSVTLYDALFLSSYLPVVIVGLLVFTGFMCIHTDTRRALLTKGSLYIQLASLLLISLSVFDIEIPAQALFGCMVLYHYTSWYIFYFLKVQAQRNTTISYLARVVIIHIAIILLYGSYTFLGVQQLAYLFSEPYFYFWTLLHIIFSSQDLVVYVKRNIIGTYRMFLPRVGN